MLNTLLENIILGYFEDKPRGWWEFYEFAGLSPHVPNTDIDSALNKLISSGQLSRVPPEKIFYHSNGRCVPYCMLLTTK